MVLQELFSRIYRTLIVEFVGGEWAFSIEDVWRSILGLSPRMEWNAPVAAPLANAPERVGMPVK